VIKNTTMIIKMPEKQNNTRRNPAAVPSLSKEKSTRKEGVSIEQLNQQMDEMMWGETDLDDIISGKVTADHQTIASTFSSRRDSNASSVTTKSRRSSES
jgi:hypothetical protein